LNEGVTEPLVKGGSIGVRKDLLTMDMEARLSQGGFLGRGSKWIFLLLPSLKVYGSFEGDRY
jgi:hypothetical protein